MALLVSGFLVIRPILDPPPLHKKKKSNAIVVTHQQPWIFSREFIVRI